MACTLGTCIWLFFGIPLASFFFPFLPPVPPLVAWICFGLAILALFGLGFFLWQSHHLTKAEQTIAAPKHTEKAIQESL